MEIPKLRIGDVEIRHPIVQGAMGVQVSSCPLPPAVTNEGGLGTITSIALGDPSARHDNYVSVSREALKREISKCRDLTDGPLALNVMGALSNVRDLIQTAVKSGINIIVYGAGIPKDLPEVVSNPNVNLVPIISSAKLAELLVNLWWKRYKCAPAGFILEGPLAGGHLGFSQEQLDDLEKFSLENILKEVLCVIKPFEERLGRKIPVIAAGGIYTGADIARMLHLGASGVQLGTRFVATHECPASDEFKQAYIDAKESDIVITKSPVGMLGRAIRNAFLDRVKEGKAKIRCPYHCISSCKINTARYCIAQALLNAKDGNVDEGLIFAGANVHRVDRIMTVKELMSELLAGIKASPLTLPVSS